MGPPLLTPFDLARITLCISAVIIDIWAQGQRLEGRAMSFPLARLLCDCVTSSSEQSRLACGDDETVVFNSNGFNLRWKLELVPVIGRVEQLMDDAVEGQGWDG